MALLPVKYYTSTMGGAPQLTNSWGDLVSLLDACLVNGFSLNTLTTLTSAAGVATAYIASGHPYQPGQVLVVKGAAETEYNGEVRVLTTTGTQFTYAVGGTPASPATGSITAAVAPLNFEKVFSGTSKGVYRSKSSASNKPFLRVDNARDPVYTTTYAKKAKVTMAEGMSDVDTFIGGRAPFNSAAPTSNEVGTGSGASANDGWYKWYYARSEANAPDTTAPATLNRSWVLVGDDRGFYLLTSHNGGPRVMYCFTDFDSFRPGDGFNTLLCATDNNTIASATPSSLDVNTQGADFGSRMSRTNDAVGKVCMRSHVQVGNPVRLSLTSLGTRAGSVVSGRETGIPWPNGPDYSLVLHPVYLQEEGAAGHLRGKLPGLLWVHNDNPLGDLVTVENVVGYSGKKVLLVDTVWSTVSTNYTARVAFDITGPWW